MNKENWVWMPHSGHLIVGNKCQFHLNTYLGNGYLVSTVGEWWPERTSREIHARIYDPEWHQDNNHLMGDTYDHAYMKRFGFEEIGAGRKYETMVFKAIKSKYGCCIWEMANGENIDSDGYNEPDKAYKGHLRMCRKWAKKGKS